MMWLGIAKYLLKDVMPQMSAMQKKEILARIRAFHTSGFKVKLYGNVCVYYKHSFLGRDFKAWSQMAHGSVSYLWSTSSIVKLF